MYMKPNRMPKPPPQPVIPLRQREALKIAVSGACGQIAYHMVFMIAKGGIFGADQPVILTLLETARHQTMVNGLAMELHDSAFELLRDVIATADPMVAFKDIDVAVLIGSMARKPGMERRDLLTANVIVFKEQGEALNEVAKKTVKVLVVGNPCNTTALICSKYAPTIPKENFMSLSRLDQNRAQAKIAKHINVSNRDVSKVIIWGNHSSIMFPDVEHARVVLREKEMSVREAVLNDHWIKNEFIPYVQQRGEEIISLCNRSTALSAMAAITDHLTDWWFGTQGDNWCSMGVYCRGEYELPEDIIYSFPVRIDKKRNWTIVPGLEISDFARLRMEANAKQLQEEWAEAELILKTYEQAVVIKGMKLTLKPWEVLPKWVEKDIELEKEEQQEEEQQEEEQKEEVKVEGEQKEGEQKEGEQKEEGQKEGEQKEGEQKEQKEGEQKEEGQKELKEGKQKEEKEKTSQLKQDERDTSGGSVRSFVFPEKTDGQ